jgi:hypothetical protein
VARRRYKSEAISQAGHAAQPRDPSGDESLSQPIEPRAEYGKAPPSAPASDQAEAKPDYDGSGLKAQIDHMRQQQQYAQQQQQPQQQLDPLASYLLSIPGLTAPKFQFLYQYFAQRPHLLNGDHWQLLKAAHDIMLGRGIQEDGPEYFQHLTQLLQQHAAPPPAPPMPSPAPLPAHEPAPPPQMPPPTHIDIEKTEDDHEPESAHMSAMYAAPVSRNDRGTAIESEMTAGSITLSKAEREHATAAGVSDEEYGRQKLRMMKMKKAKLIRDE